MLVFKESLRGARGVPVRLGRFFTLQTEGVPCAEPRADAGPGDGGECVPQEVCPERDSEGGSGAGSRGSGGGRRIQGTNSNG